MDRKMKNSQAGGRKGRSYSLPLGVGGALGVRRGGEAGR